MRQKRSPGKLGCHSGTDAVGVFQHLKQPGLVSTLAHNFCETGKALATGMELCKSAPYSGADDHGFSGAVALEAGVSCSLCLDRRHDGSLYKSFVYYGLVLG